MNIKKWQIFVIIFCLILGTILHFTYEWSNYNIIVGIFSTIKISIFSNVSNFYNWIFYSRKKSM